MPDTFTVTTGRGAHYYFQQPATPLGNMEGQLKGSGMSTCAAREATSWPRQPSRQRSDVRPPGPDRPVLPCPAWLVEALTRKPPR